MPRKIEYKIKRTFPETNDINFKDLVEKYTKINNENLANYIYEKAKKNLGLQ